MEEAATAVDQPLSASISEGFAVDWPERMRTLERTTSKYSLGSPDAPEPYTPVLYVIAHYKRKNFLLTHHTHHHQIIRCASLFSSAGAALPLPSVQPFSTPPIGHPEATLH